MLSAGKTFAGIAVAALMQAVALADVPKLRAGGTFHDGTLLEGIAGIETPDPVTFVFWLKAPA